MSGSIRSLMLWIWWQYSIFLLLRLEVYQCTLNRTNFSTELNGFTESNEDALRMILSRKEIEDISASVASDYDILNFNSTEPLITPREGISNSSVELSSTNANESIEIYSQNHIPKPLSPVELKIPQCEDSADCAYGGKCVADGNDYKSCLCPASCPVTIPVSCHANSEYDYCMSMSESYREKFNLPNPTCHMNTCVCPPMFSPWKLEWISSSVALLPFKCDRRELQVQGVIMPSDSVYQGMDATLLCCINTDPRTFVYDDGVHFIQNSSIIRESTSTPYEEDFTAGFEPPRCWSLEVKNAQFSDSGSYLCHVKTRGRHDIHVNFTIEFVVKARRMIQNITVKSNATHAEVYWDAQEGPMLKIDFKLLRRTDGVTVWTSENAKSGIVIHDLLPATPYTLFISVFDEQNDPFKITEQFTTAESVPEPPTLGEIRTLKLRDGLKCEVEWTPPKIPNGRITKYYVTVRGSIRHANEDVIANDDFPLSEPDRCANFNGDEKDSTAADAIADFYSCRFGPLKPNRNYTTTVWAENGAGISLPVSFSDSCMTDFAEPDLVDPPMSSLQNGTSFSLTFGNRPDDTNGPISCYYVAIVPLDADVAIENLPSPNSLVVDTFSKTMSNNLRGVDSSLKTTKLISNHRYFAYIAESYANFPVQTTIGDGNTTGGSAPCNVLYLSRHKPEDPALMPGLKYTGFLIARVDRDESRDVSSRLINFQRRRKRSWFNHATGTESLSHSRLMRQLFSSGPTYGFSGYFKPIILMPFDAKVVQLWISVLFVSFSLLIFAIFVFALVTYILHKRGMVKHWCPISKDRTLLRPHFHATPVEDLPSEFIIRHRDSNFLFISEFEALPHYHRSCETSASERQENAHKNRYNDIKAFDSTRVKLSVVNGDPPTDYINANFVKGYKNRKNFIATQGPVDASINDYWRMVWEHDVQLIVMVANLYERSRCQCSKYWPDDGPQVFDTIKVQPMNSTFYSDYAIRTFEIQKIKVNETNAFPSGQPAIIAYEKKCDENGLIDEPSAVIISSGRPLNKGSFESVPNSEYANVPSISSRSSRCSINLRSGSNHMESELLRSSADNRKVTQYHYTSWNDLQAPECTTGLLRFLFRLRNMQEFNKTAVVVHCSAGVGRTGTFIALDSLLDQCIEEGKADVFGIVSEMRKQRNLMVQNYEQYVFIYKALAEWFMFGETDVEVGMFSERYQLLKGDGMHEKYTSSSNVSNAALVAANVLKSSTRFTRNDPASYDRVLDGMEAEFKRLDQSLELNRTCFFANKAENSKKNRFSVAIPYDQCRVVLSVIIGNPTDSTYINASLVKGYFYPYILLQDPVDENNCYDFWRMIGDQNSKVIVMLSNESEFSPCEKYWSPEVGKSISFGRDGDVSVKLISEELHSTYILHKITYKFSKDKYYREVIKFGCLCWPLRNLVPVSSDALIDLVSRVLSLQSDHQDAGPIVLHSRDGSTETGLFCCISLLLERLKAESRVDVFQTVRSLQQNRPLIFKHFEQYSFCYQTVMDYLNSFNKLANLPKRSNP